MRSKASTTRAAFNQQLQRINRAQQRLDVVTLDLLETIDDVRVVMKKTKNGYVIPIRAAQRLRNAIQARARAWRAMCRTEEGATLLERELARFDAANGHLHDAIALTVAVQEGEARRRARHVKPKKKREGA